MERLFSLYERKIKDFLGRPWSLVLITCRARIFPRKKSRSWSVTTKATTTKKLCIIWLFFSLCTHPFMQLSYITEMKNCAWNDPKRKSASWFFIGQKRKKEMESTKLNHHSLNHHLSPHLKWKVNLACFPLLQGCSFFQFLARLLVIVISFGKIHTNSPGFSPCLLSYLCCSVAEQTHIFPLY